MTLPLGIRESLERVDDGLAASEADIQGLTDLVHDDGPVSPAVTSFLARKKAQLGHLRTDFEELPARIEGER